MDFAVREAHAQTVVGSQCPPSGPAITVVYDNDIRAMTLFRGSDDNYTTGIKISVSTPSHDATVRENRLHRLFPFSGFAGQCHRTTYSIGGNMYTPTAITNPNRIFNDRPYAGWGYLSYAMDSYSPNLRDSETFEVNIGVVGPMTGGRAIQTWVHDKISQSPIPKGWSHQLRNTPGVYASYQQKRRVTDPVARDWADFAVSWGGTLGNVFTYPTAGASARLGYHVHDSGPASGPLPPPINAVDTSSSAPPKGNNFSAYVFVQGDGRLVFRNIFIDGGSFADERHNIRKKYPVGDFQMGFVIRYKSVAFTYRTVARSKEFDLQRKPHYYGSIGLTIGRSYNP